MKVFNLHLFCVIRMFVSGRMLIQKVIMIEEF